jgi:hypothetical protein
MKKGLKKNRPLAIIGEKINIDSFEALGFDKDLLSEIDSKIANKDLREILKRDLKENIFALLTESYKTALVLSGSIIESLIFHKVLESGIKKHLPNSKSTCEKRVIDMDLSELLFTADNNDILDIQLSHLSQALRQYRNFIHPAVEIRKGKIKNISKKKMRNLPGI